MSIGIVIIQSYLYYLQSMDQSESDRRFPGQYFSLCKPDMKNIPGHVQPSSSLNIPNKAKFRGASDYLL